MGARDKGRVPGGGWVKQTWEGEEMTGMAGRRVTLTDFIKPVSNYIEENVGFLTVAERYV